jgi:hypothetical protein
MGKQVKQAVAPRDAQSLRNLAVAQYLTAAEDDAGAHCHGLCGLRPARQH